MYCQIVILCRYSIRLYKIPFYSHFTSHYTAPESVPAWCRSADHICNVGETGERSSEERGDGWQKSTRWSDQPSRTWPAQDWRHSLRQHRDSWLSQSTINSECPLPCNVTCYCVYLVWLVWEAAWWWPVVSVHCSGVQWCNDIKLANGKWPVIVIKHNWCSTQYIHYIHTTADTTTQPSSTALLRFR